MRLSGNIKELYWQSRTFLDDRPYTHNMTRASLVADYRRGLAAAHADYRHELRFGSFFKTRDFQAFDLGQSPFFLRLQDRLLERASWQYNHGVYRGWAGLEADRAALRLGRQRIAWGTGKLWNPTDVLNPYNPLSLEREERRGVDAAYLRLALGDLTQFEAVYAPQDTGRQTQFVERFRTHVGRADLSVLGGKVAGDEAAWMVGGDLAADLFGGSLHGEFTVTDPVVREAFARWLAGYEYRLPAGRRASWLDDLWLLAEYYHNGAGAAHPRFYDFAAVLSGRETVVAREYAGLGMSKDITPLWNVELFGIRNVKDRSTFLGPAVKWNALDDLDLLAGAQVFLGPELSEYGRLAPIYYLQAQLFFDP